MSAILGDILTLGGGGGSSSTFAVITVVYPEGAVCTATNGSKTLTAPDTSGSAIFSIPEPEQTPEVWTLSYQKGNDTRSLTVTISAFGQSEYIILSSVNDTPWSVISEVSVLGIGDVFWDIGDCKEITLNGTIGSLSLSNYKTCVFILDFNHPDNGVPSKTSVWGCFKTAVNNNNK